MNNHNFKFNPPKWQGLRNPLTELKPQNPLSGWRGLRNPCANIKLPADNPLSGWKGLGNPFK